MSQLYIDKDSGILYGLQTAVDSSSRRRRKAPDHFGDWDYSD